MSGTSEFEKNGSWVSKISRHTHISDHINGLVIIVAIYLHESTIIYCLPINDRDPMTLEAIFFYPVVLIPGHQDVLGRRFSHLCCGRFSGLIHSFCWHRFTDATWPRNAAASFVIMETVEQAQWIVDNLNGCLENQSCDKFHGNAVLSDSGKNHQDLG